MTELQIKWSAGLVVAPFALAVFWGMYMGYPSTKPLLFGSIVVLELAVLIGMLVWRRKRIRHLMLAQEGEVCINCGQARTPDDSQQRCPECGNRFTPIPGSRDRFQL